MDIHTRARLTEMLKEVRSWSCAPDGALEDLARRHRLDPLIVRRILESEFGALAVADAVAPDPARADKRTEELGAVGDD